LLSASVLIVSDDPEFARALAARWQAERHVPEITIATGSVFQSAAAANQDLIVVGPLRNSDSNAVLRAANASSGAAAIYFAEDARQIGQIQSEYPHLLGVPRADGWANTLVLIAVETLRRIEAVRRAQRAEAVALVSQSHAALGRYMLEVRPSVNNALTSMMGNADLLLDPQSAGTARREQIETIHAMALRLNEIMHRFSSLAAELRTAEKESQAETHDEAFTLSARS
jgi:signal transduction histidine kinase